VNDGPNLKNSYLDQVVAQQAQLESDLKVQKRQRMAMPAQALAPGGGRGQMAAFAAAPPPNAVEVRVTGFWRWKTVVVPPNAFVVHTRKGKTDPLHIGLGVSFSFNPAIDSYLVVPGAMQTILINAYCICKELQGLLVQGYVQWIIQDFGTAYKKLDFGDADDPMRLVNLQLREQAEAAIKDKVATMSIRDVLSDKQPIMEELTSRLRALTEGSGGNDKGLGLRIVGVQVKEAVVSSSRLCENLQKPYRSEQARIARLAELEAEEQISEREQTTAKRSEESRLENERNLAVVRARNDSETFDRDSKEKLRRAKLDHDAQLERAALEKTRSAAEADAERAKVKEQLTVTKLKREGELADLEERRGVAMAIAKRQLELDEQKQEIDNSVSAGSIQARLVASLPQVLEKMPKPNELHSVNIGGGELASLAGVVAQLQAVLGALQGSGAAKNGKS
jgi:hypothetical protein